MAKQNDDELDDIEMMSLELDDGTNLECEIVATFDVEDTSYIALLPVEAPEGYDDDEVLVLNFQTMNSHWNQLMMKKNSIWLLMLLMKFWMRWNSIPCLKMTNHLQTQ